MGREWAGWGAGGGGGGGGEEEGRRGEEGRIWVLF